MKATWSKGIILKPNMFEQLRRPWTVRRAILHHRLQQPTKGFDVCSGEVCFLFVIKVCLLQPFGQSKLPKV